MIIHEISNVRKSRSARTQRHELSSRLCESAGICQAIAGKRYVQYPLTAAAMANAHSSQTYESNRQPSNLPPPKPNVAAASERVVAVRAKSLPRVLSG